MRGDASKKGRVRGRLYRRTSCASAKISSLLVKVYVLVSVAPAIDKRLLLLLDAVAAAENWTGAKAVVVKGEARARAVITTVHFIVVVFALASTVGLSRNDIYTPVFANGGLLAFESSTWALVRPPRFHLAGNRTTCSVSFTQSIPGAARAAPMRTLLLCISFFARRKKLCFEVVINYSSTLCELRVHTV